MHPGEPKLEDSEAMDSKSEVSRAEVNAALAVSEDPSAPPMSQPKPPSGKSTVADAYDTIFAAWIIMCYSDNRALSLLICALADKGKKTKALFSFWLAKKLVGLLVIVLIWIGVSLF